LCAVLIDTEYEQLIPKEEKSPMVCKSHSFSLSHSRWWGETWLFFVLSHEQHLSKFFVSISSGKGFWY